MDELFLHVLRKRPEIGPAIFFSLFKHVDNRSIIRFLSDRATSADCLRVMWGLPWGPFLKQLPQLLIRHA